ncbi:hypothetical protein M0R72_05630 [Candidatus Pacearchaeota archaeon]|jgi:hypothetical protein|nr:hypothetical protein [Candidatus Pacearchaeota archaeon]
MNNLDEKINAIPEEELREFARQYCSQCDKAARRSIANIYFVKSLPRIRRRNDELVEALITRGLKCEIESSQKNYEENKKRLQKLGVWNSEYDQYYNDILEGKLDHRIFLELEK